MKQSHGDRPIGTEVVVRRLTDPTAAEIAELSGLFDQYRAHYRQPIEAGRSASWLRPNLESGRLTAFIAETRGERVGFAITMEVPASLRLGHYWQVRDLFVAPDRRRLGVARTLLEGVRRAAIASGALRLTVQTEVENIGALELYATSGFTSVEGYRGLTLQFLPDEGRP